MQEKHNGMIRGGLTVMDNTKWYVTTILMPDDILYVGITEGEYGVEITISEHDTEEQAEQACIEYAKENHIPTFAEYKMGKLLMEVIES